MYLNSAILQNLTIKPKSFTASTNTINIPIVEFENCSLAMLYLENTSYLSTATPHIFDPRDLINGVSLLLLYVVSGSSSGWVYDLCEVKYNKNTGNLYTDKGYIPKVVLYSVC
ncbi:MAG: hypothetical protein ACRC1R_00500 [Cetobacterium sp.]